MCSNLVTLMFPELDVVYVFNEIVYVYVFDIAYAFDFDLVYVFDFVYVVVAVFTLSLTFMFSLSVCHMSPPPHTARSLTHVARGPLTCPFP